MANDGFDRSYRANFVDTRNLGLSLLEVEVDCIDAGNEEIVSQWFHSESDLDLYVWTDSRQNVIKTQIQLGGQIAEWNILDGAKTGIIIEEEPKGGNSAIQQKIQYDKEPLGPFLRQASDIVSFVPSLALEAKNTIIRYLVQSPTFETLHPEELIRRFGTHLSKNKCFSFWQHVKSLFHKHKES